MSRIVTVAPFCSRNIYDERLRTLTVGKVLKVEVKFDASKSEKELGLTYRPLGDTLRDTAHSVSTHARSCYLLLG